MVIKSEYGKGLCYCLGLFIAHELWDVEGLEQRPESWFYGAADHLFQLRYEDAPTKYLAQRCKAFRIKCLTWRLPMFPKERPKNKDKLWAIAEAKILLRLIDKANGVKTERGMFE